ncbi:MAG: Galactose-1-phosphate uridylyltransferase [Alphaproteobacteria bacterium MarineAlpha5_Bin11]|nr:galactose-1-phosphate uridylyltransferase [Pelagibacteraceae bacterium]PPR44218.1 MAG: Galactose-1-phosphate uridylyltransferase [Alphaproteobacteria bacterium MarineAlpha5_Bin11]PPR51657.1 MAG: Galactose-1-phosphate uridylyltransferase [Alphaproteobacteria bacterium MarineAlpha5_Bin10]|tara:strand:- start:16846 stop:17895 length:1050 start_codon:yes stop_codon:yes gene_type:complete
MKKIYKRSFVRNDKKNILLFGYKKHTEQAEKELAISADSKPHMRWHPFRNEWITYSPGRKNRTAFPSKKYCPLCPSKKIQYPTEIPFKKFEIAVFPNRWASFNFHKKNFKLKKIRTKISKGSSEVIIYSDKHNETIADMSIERLELLVYTWIDRYRELLKVKDIKYVMPFENRGKECGVTLHHPHGQIYAYPFIPPVIQNEEKIFNKKNYLGEIMQELDKKYWVYKNDDMIAAVPPFARYSYEVWIIPRKKVAGPWNFNDKQIKSYARSLKKVVKGYDLFLGKKCPYIMGLHAAPQLNNNKFHFHTEFYPPLRSKNRPKILAGSESMAGTFVMDVVPEDSARILRKFMR